MVVHAPTARLMMLLWWCSAEAEGAAARGRGRLRQQAKVDWMEEEMEADDDVLSGSVQETSMLMMLDLRV